MIVVGGGLMGMLSARELALSGVRVALFERRAMGQESSWAGGGILSPLYPWRYPAAVNDLARWSQEAYPELLARLHRETGIDPEYVPSGLLMLDADQQAAGREWARAYPTPLRLLDAAELRVEEPELAPDWRQGCLFPELGQVRNPRLAAAVRADLLRLGVSLHEQTPVESLLLRAGRVRGVRAGGRDWHVPQVVLAGGAWSAGLLDASLSTPPVRPVRGQMMLYRIAAGRIRHIVLHGGHYVIPRRDGHLLVGSTLEEVGFDKQVTDEARAELTAWAGELFPFLRGESPVKHWAGLRPGSPQGIPCIAEHPEVTGLFINAGHYRNGVVMGPASARLLADLMLGRKPILDPAPFHLFEPVSA